MEQQMKQEDDDCDSDSTYREVDNFRKLLMQAAK